jgi:hypothetical protein
LINTYSIIRSNTSKAITITGAAVIWRLWINTISSDLKRKPLASSWTS